MTPEERKARPIATGVLAYFPDAIMEVANCSFIGNQQHNPGQPLHWAKEKSTDHDDALSRHHTDRLAGQKFDTDGVRHRAKAAWRALAALQVEIEEEQIEAVDQKQFVRESMAGQYASVPTRYEVYVSKYHGRTPPLTEKEFNSRDVVIVPKMSDPATRRASLPGVDPFTTAAYPGN